MDVIINKSQLSGEIVVPGSKSHTIRALAFGFLAKGISVIKGALESRDTKAMQNVLSSFGVKIEKDGNTFIIDSMGFPFKNSIPSFLDLLNSGTSLNITTGICSLLNKEITLDGDNSLRKRPMAPILDALKKLGLSVINYNSGYPPFTICGSINGGETSIIAKNSQYLTSLLIALPLAKNDSIINVELLYEKPYVEMTLSWLDKLGIEYKNENFQRFYIKGNQRYRNFETYIPADWSSAAFPIAAGVLASKDKVIIKGVDYNDYQGDKKFVDILRKMGAKIDIFENYLVVYPSELNGIEIDLNDTPDLLPILAVVASFAKGYTKIYNVEQARIKETDRIKAMTNELVKVGIEVEELQDGMIIKGGKFKEGITVNGYDDHRIIMAFSVAGLLTNGLRIKNIEAVDVTFPDFYIKFEKLGADFKFVEDK